MSGGGEIFIGIVSGTGATVASATLIYGVRQIRKIAGRIEEVMQTPRELVELRSVVATNTQSIGNLSSAFNQLSEVLNRLTTIAESRASGGSS